MRKTHAFKNRIAVANPAVVGKQCGNRSIEQFTIKIYVLRFQTKEIGNAKLKRKWIRIFRQREKFYMKGVKIFLKTRDYTGTSTALRTLSGLAQSIFFTSCQRFALGLMRYVFIPHCDAASASRASNILLKNFHNIFLP